MPIHWDFLPREIRRPSSKHSVWLYNMHGMDKKRKRQATSLTKLCKLSELGRCKRRFKPKTYNQEFCKPEHQTKYWNIIKREKRLTIRLLGDHEKRIKELERRIKKLEEKKHGK